MLNLPAEAAAAHQPVSLRGVVTAAEPDWKGKFFIQDASAGIFIVFQGARQPAVGDLVRVDGGSTPGAFAPTVHARSWTKIGTGPLPAPQQIPIEELISGSQDGQRVEVVGYVHSVHRLGPRYVLDTAVGGYRIHVLSRFYTRSPVDLIGARIRVSGTTAASYNARLRHLTSVNLYVAQPNDLIVETPESTDPFDLPAIPLNAVGQYRANSGPNDRIHVRGTVTFQRPGQDLFLQDETGGLRIQTQQSPRLLPGDVVEVVGFCEFDHFLPVLRDGEIKPVPNLGAALRVDHPSEEELRQGAHYADFVSLRGKVVDRTVERTPGVPDGPSILHTLWLIQTPRLTFQAILDGDEPQAIAPGADLGSTVEVTGICLSEIYDDGRLKTLQVLLPTAAHLQVLTRSSWFTAQRLLVGVSLLSLALAAAVGWTLMLERRVRERTEQLRVEMTARKAAELQFKAVLGERTRLAQELHDSLEQTLTGIGLQLDTATRLFRREPEEAMPHLELASSWMRQSQIELRRSIWDLRSRELEQFNLAQALRQSAEQITSGTATKVEMEVVGDSLPLSEVVEENLLRIAQEAVTNVLKHSAASAVRIVLQFAPSEVSLTIIDNGRGFEPGVPGKGRERQFGLLGMSERAKRLNGRIEVVSSPAAGASIRAILPVPS